MEYILSRNSRVQHLIDIEFSFFTNSQTVQIQLPAWRPGRYELQNFAKNIVDFNVFDGKNKALKFNKITKDCWQIESNSEKVKICYSYFCNQKDAGNSFVNDDIFYINFVNCLVYQVGYIDNKCKISLKLPDNYCIASGLDFVRKGSNFVAQSASYYQLVDSPVFASINIQSKSYQSNSVSFNISILGNYIPNWDVMISAFQKFTDYQGKMMGQFPFKDYTFLIWILPTAYYHGVEHANSTVIVLGPDIEGDNLLVDMIGVCSHELFHAWNICKIRPAELLPYDFKKENYFNTGFVVEGITTYLGDLILKKCGVFTEDEYIKELTAILKRHFETSDSAALSLAESSFDLWLDGYSAGIPNRKVSIYQKGAIVSLILDLMIRIKHDHNKSIETIMQMMWQNFGKKQIGYTFTDYKEIAEQAFGGNLNEYFNNCIIGNGSIKGILNQNLKQIGLQMLLNEEGLVSILALKKVTKTQKYHFDKFLNNNPNA